MEVPKTYRENFKVVIQPTIKELKDKDDCLIDFKVVKERFYRNKVYQDTSYCDRTIINKKTK